MHIEEVSFFENEVFGTIQIPFTEGVDLERYGNGDVTIIDHADDGKNHYTFIIGDNGVGKTNLLNSVANIYHNSPRLMFYVNKKKDKVRKPYIKYVGSGLYSAENEFNELDVKVVNPNRISISRQLVGLFYYYPEKVELLERQLKKWFAPVIEISFNYRTITKNKKRYYQIGTNNDYATQTWLKSWFLGRSEEYDGIIKEKIAKTDSYKLLENFSIDRDGIQWRDFVETRLFGLIKDRLQILGYNPNENIFSGKLYNIKRQLRDPFCSIPLHVIEGDLERKKELLYVMLLEELGIIRINMKCEFNGGTCDVSALSTGEKLMIKYFTIFTEIAANRKKNIIFLCDEPENSLHPQWQKEFPGIMRTIIEDIYEIKNSHFIFTTHSPLIVMRSASLENSMTIRMVRDTNGKVAIEPIDDVPQYSFERALLDVFACSYYTESEVRANLDKIKEEELRRQKLLEATNPDCNGLEIVNKSFDVFSELEKLYSQLIKG